MGISYAALGLAAALVIVLAVVIVLVRTSRRVPSVESGKGARRVPLLLGVALVAVVLGAELREILTPAGPAEGRLPVRIEAPRPEAPVDRVQVLCFVTDHSGLAVADAVDGGTVPSPGLGETVRVEVDAHDAEIDLTWADRLGFPDRVQYGIRTRRVFGDHFTSGTGAGFRRIDLGDGRPFVSVAFFQPARTTLRLRAVKDAQYSVWVRGLHDGERLVGVPEAEVLAAAAPAHREMGAIVLQPAFLPYDPRPIVRLLQELHPGALLFLAGLALILHRRVSFWRGAALATLVVVVVLGTCARLERNVWLDAIDSGDPAARMSAAAGLARSKAFPRSSAGALARAYDAERDPGRKAALLTLTASRGNPMQRLPAARGLREKAADAADATLRELAAEIESHVEREMPED